MYPAWQKKSLHKPVFLAFIKRGSKEPVELPTPKKQKQQQEEDDEDLAMDSFHPLQPTDPPVLPLSEKQPAAAPDLEASRSRSKTHSKVSEAPTISYP